tara:strand:- start:10464 stop:10601 length:138 start_codon:yes stop_codon:yes gene_type:complete
MKVIKNILIWDEMMMRRMQRKFKLSDYQIAWIAFGKGFVIGAILL